MFLSPYMYFIPSNIPFLNIGITKYHPISKITPMNYEYIEILPENIHRFLNVKNRSLEISRVLNSAGYNCFGLYDLGDAIPKLNRYPILLDSIQARNSIFDKLQCKGLGPSKMYQTTVNNIDGLEGYFLDQGPFPNAAKFAETLITLPTHNNVSDNVLNDIHDILLRNN